VATQLSEYEFELWELVVTVVVLHVLALCYWVYKLSADGESAPVREKRAQKKD